MLHCAQTALKTFKQKRPGFLRGASVIWEAWRDQVRERERIMNES